MVYSLAVTLWRMSATGFAPTSGPESGGRSRRLPSRAPRASTLSRVQGQAADIDIHAREILKLRDRMNEILASHTGRPIEQIARDSERDYYMTGDEALAYGLVDRVVRERSQAGSNGGGDGSTGANGGNGSANGDGNSGANGGGSD